MATGTRFSPIFLLVILSPLALAAVRYDHFQVHRVIPRNPNQLAKLVQLQSTPMGYDFWSDVSKIGQPVDIMVPPHMKYDFQDFLAALQLDDEVWIENVQNLIDREQPPMTARNATSEAYNWERYQTLNELNAWLTSLPEKYPGIVETVVGGKSYEGRDILGVKISFKPGNKAVFLEGGIHAREWIAPATVTFIANELLTSKDPAVRAVAESRDWYVFPSFNPDGYVYTHNYNRMWRKTRKPYGSCYGADPNRNWDYKWMQGGASSNPCSETHAGSSAFSEIETATLSKYISSIADQLDGYIGFHSYSQLLLIPFGHSGLETPANNDELLRIGRNGMNALAKRYGTRYVVGNIPQAIYIASGGSMDWVLGTYRHIRLAYTYELRDTGRYGFILPPEQIVPTAEETLDSLVSIIQEVNDNPQ